MISNHFLSIANFVLTIIFVSFILRSKRPPGNTLAWLFFIAVVPYIGIPLYIFLTDRKFPSRFSKKSRLFQVQGDSLPAQPDIETLLGRLGAPPPRTNSKLSLILNGQDAYEKITEIITSAQENIHLTTFIFANDEVGREILKILTVKAKQGVSVKLLLDSLGAIWVRNPSLLDLKKAGGQVAYFMPLLHIPFKGRSNLRNHRKILVVDSSKAIIGGMNIAQEYMGPTSDSQRWVDLGLSLEGSSALDLDLIFKKDWEFANGK